MTVEKNILALEPIGASDAQNDASLYETSPHAPSPNIADEWLTSDMDADAPSTQPLARFDRWALILALIALAMWSGFFIWANQTALVAHVITTPNPALWGDWLSAWSGPVLLIGLGWLIITRSNHREAQRFVETTRLLAEESTQLETRLVSVNQELSLAREFIAAQSRDLEALGRQAVDRLSQHAAKLSMLVRDNSAQIESIGSVSASALENMERLRGQLPVLTNAAKDVTNNIGTAGRTAHAQLQDLVSGFNRLNEFGQASERQVDNLRSKIDAALSSFEVRNQDLDSHTRSQIASVEAHNSNIHATMLDHQAELQGLIRVSADALATHINETGQRITAQMAEAERLEQALHDSAASHQAILASRRAEIEENQRQNVENMAQQMVAFDTEIGGRHTRQEARIAALGAQNQSVAAQLEAIEKRVLAITEAGSQAESSLMGRLENLGARLHESHATIDATDTAIAGLTNSSVRLLELIQAGAKHSSIDLVQAIDKGEARLADVEARAILLRDAMSEANRSSEALASHVVKTHESLGQTQEEMQQIHSGFSINADAHARQLAQLKQELSALEAQSGAAATMAETTLSAAIGQLSTAARDAVSQIETEGAGSITAMAARLGAESSEAIEKSMRLQMAELAGKLEQAAAHAAGVSREATVQLRAQLGKVDELIGNLESRVSQARMRAEEQVDNDFARRVALITESLNSSAIDIAKTLDVEVSDIAWAAYLRGDRGVFTRRAVKLLDAPDAKAVVQLYENDDAFRDHVSHYIHDFEGMLRQLLSTRDGHALGVTLLSSDMGKLYVALAQAIERLRN